MNRSVFYTLSVLFLVMICAETIKGQQYPERKLIREGNRDYEKGKYVDSEIDYRRALEKTPWSYEAAYNLGNALYKQDRFDEASQVYAKLDSLGMTNAAAAHYNNGNALLKQRKLDEAIEEYKKSLLINPDDQQAKFNLAYAKKLRDEKENQDDQKDDKQDKDNQDQNQDNKNDPNKDKKDDQDKSDPKDQQQQKSEISKEEAERMLEAIQMSEDKTREKMDEKQAKAVGRSKKNW